MSDDPELDMILARKRRELLAMAARQGAGKAVEQSSAKKDPVEVLRAVLIDRGDEVLEAALSQYPEETRSIARRLAELVERGAIAGKITGRQLLWLFKQLGLDVRLETKIYVEQDGRFVPLMDAMKRKD